MSTASAPSASSAATVSAPNASSTAARTVPAHPTPGYSTPGHPTSGHPTPGHPTSTRATSGTGRGERWRRPFRTPVRGFAFAGPAADHLDGARAIAPGTAARLVREPDNPADALAVAVWVCAEAGAPWRAGYLDRAVAARLAPRLDRGLDVEATIEGWTHEPDGRWQRPLLCLVPRHQDVTAPEHTDGIAARTRSHAGVVAPSHAPPTPSAGRDLTSRMPGVRRRRVQAGR